MKMIKTYAAALTMMMTVVPSEQMYAERLLYSILGITI